MNNYMNNLLSHIFNFNIFNLFYIFTTDVFLLYHDDTREINDLTK